jgi:outer membrane protein assembly factor BamD
VAINGRLILCLAIVCALCSCSLFSSSKKEDPDEKEAAELKSDKQKPIDTPEAELVQQAKRQYATGLFSVAKESFEGLRDGYPLGAYGEFAEIKAADSYFESGEYGAAALLYEEFTKNRPASLALDYMLVRAARSYQLSNRGAGRDAGALHKALEIYTRLLQQFPNSIYAQSAGAFKSEVEDRLAEQEKIVIDFYRKQGKDNAAEARARAFQDRFGKSSDSFELAAAESAKLAKEVKAVDQTHVVTVENAPFEDAVSGEPAAIPQPEETGQVPAQSATPAPTGGLPGTGTALIRSVECNSDSRVVSVSLDRVLQGQPSAEITTGGAAEGTPLRVSIKGIRTANGKALVQDCFGSKDLSISGDGVFAFNFTTKTATVFDLDNPPRILIALQ